MLNFNKALISKIISLIIAVSFFLTGFSYAGASSEGSLRVPVGEERIYKRMEEVAEEQGGAQLSAAEQLNSHSKNTAKNSVLTADKILDDDLAVLPQFNGSERERRERVAKLVTSLYDELKKIPKGREKSVSYKEYEGMLRNTSEGYTLDVSGYGEGFGIIRIIDDYGDKSSLLSGNKIYYFPSRNIFGKNRKILSLISQIVKLLRGGEFEIDFSYYGPSPLESGYWKAWQTTKAYKEYQKFIHPITAQIITNIIEKMGLNEIKLVDIFGGNGSFLERLHGMLAQISRPVGITCYLIENSDNAGSKISSAPVKVIQKDLVREPNIRQHVRTKVHIITALGGLNSSVIGLDDAFTIAQQVYDSLEENGVFVLTGITYSWLSSKDLQKIGFEVRNMTIPQNYMDKIPQIQLYIAVKPTTNAREKVRHFLGRNKIDSAL